MLITFELAEGVGVYSRAAFIIPARSYSINFIRLNTVVLITFEPTGGGGAYSKAAYVFI